MGQKTVRRRAQGPRARAAGARGRKKACKGAVARERFAKGSLPGLSRCDRDLRQALERAPFRIQRVWRAIRAGASLLNARPFGDSLLLSALRVSEAKKKSSTRKGGGGRAWHSAIGEARPRKGRDANQSPAPKAISLLRLLERSGADIWELDKYGQGFERWAFAGNGSLMPVNWRLVESALEWWRDAGGHPGRSGAGASNLAEAAVARGAMGLKVLERVWPQECSWSVLDEALGRAGELVLAREAHFNGMRGLSDQWVSLKNLTPLSELSWAAGVILNQRPQAARADRSLSSLMERRAPHYLERIRALESQAIARQEAVEIAGSLGSAAPSRIKAL